MVSARMARALRGTGSTRAAGMQMAAQAAAPGPERRPRARGGSRRRADTLLTDSGLGQLLQLWHTGISQLALDRLQDPQRLSEVLLGEPGRSGLKTIMMKR